MLLLKWIKIVWSKRSRYFLGTIQQIALTFSITSSFVRWIDNSFVEQVDDPAIAILCTLLSKAIRFLPVNFLFDNKTLIVLLESLFSSLSVNFNWNDCNEINENNKSRKIKEFKSKAETALRFVESYGLVPQYLTKPP
jgi:hypothetical protein